MGKRNLARCSICNKEIPEDNLLMLSHLVSLHPYDLMQSESFQTALVLLSEKAYEFGVSLGRLFRGEP